MSKTDSKLITEGNITKPACYLPRSRVDKRCCGIRLTPKDIEDCKNCFLFNNEICQTDD